MAERLLCLFKSSRRSEYTQENLRILSGAVDDEVTVAYKQRWQSEDVRDRAPETGDPVLIVLADPPYAKSHPIRRAEVMGVTSVDDTLRLRLRLGLRVVVDGNRWRKLAQAGENPLTGAFAVRVPLSDGVIEELTDPEQELRAWKRQIDAVSHGDGYGRVAFLRVGRVSEVGGDPLVGPYRLVSRRTYQVDVLAYNPHLDPDTLAALRLVAFPEPSKVEVAMDSLPIPADGPVELMLVPQDEGPASLEFSVSRGAEFWFGLELGWSTVPAALPEPTPVAEPRPTVAASVPVPDAGPEAPVSSPVARHDTVSSHLLRAYMLLRVPEPVDADTRLRVLDELLRTSPGHERLLEQRGIAMHELGRWQEASEQLDGLTSGVLSAEGRTMLVASWFRQGRLPDPLDRIAVADYARDEWFEMLLTASRNLTTDEQVKVASLLAQSVLTEDRASRWVSPLAMDRELPRRDRLDLLDIWQHADPAAAAAGVQQLVEAGDIELGDPQFAAIALDLAVEAHRMKLARLAAFAILAHHADREDLDGLEQLLDIVLNRLDRQARREIGEEVVMAIADVADDGADIDGALQAAAELIEDQRQRGDLDAAARLARFVSSNRHRASRPVAHRISDVLSRLDEAMSSSETIRRFEEARRRELNHDLKDFVGGKRVLVVGANEQPWWPDIRAEFGFDVTSEWVSTERRKAPSLDRLLKKLDSVELLIVQTGRIGHKTSEPLMRAAKERRVQTITVPRPTRDAFTMSLRVGLAARDPSLKGGLSGLDLGGLMD
ncbi:MAG: hypothetical protein PVH07_02480 [Chloroflexota bacterium]|jgi:hypothetical protein